MVRSCVKARRGGRRAWFVTREACAAHGIDEIPEDAEPEVKGEVKEEVKGEVKEVKGVQPIERFLRPQSAPEPEPAPGAPLERLAKSLTSVFLFRFCQFFQFFQLFCFFHFFQLFRFHSSFILFSTQR